MGNSTIRFIATPFLPEYQPALGVSNLLSIVKLSGYTADIKYLNIDFGQKFGWTTYNFISTHTPPELLIGEYIFTKALGLNNDSDFKDYRNKLYNAWGSKYDLGIDFSEFMDDVKFLFDIVPKLIEKWADEVLLDDPKIIAFTTTFQQNISSLALAKIIKQRKGNDIKIVFGGANCEENMGKALFDNFNFVDYVVSGEAENVILDVMAQCIKSLGQPDRAYIEGMLVDNLDTIPLPDFSDYFKSISNKNIKRLSYLSFESSRGCWWGMKSHCTFCGLNGNNMKYRSKSPELFIEQLKELATKYKNDHFMITDNILDINYIKSVFPKLSTLENSLTLFYETKSNLKKDQLETMAAGGVNSLQPGIESLSTPILKLMAKGTNKLQNLQLLKWGKELKINIIWNFLFGFPNEDIQEYEEMKTLVPLIHHLKPPIGYGKIRIDRFGPYWKQPEKYQVINLRPCWSYLEVYKLSPKYLNDIAYYFEFEYGNNIEPLSYVKNLVSEINNWIEKFQRSELEIVENEDGTKSVYDTRECAENIFYKLGQLELEVLMYLDYPNNKSNLCDLLIKNGQSNYSLLSFRHELDLIIDCFIRKKFIVQENDKLFSLVLNKKAYLKILEKKERFKLEL